MEATAVERIHLKFMKHILHVKMSTPSSFVYGELGTYPLMVSRLVRIVKYWLKIMTSKPDRYICLIYNCLLNNIHDVPSTENWASLLRDTLYKFGFGYVWTSQYIGSCTGFLTEFKQRAYDIYTQMWKNQLSSLSRFSGFSGGHLGFKM